MTKMFSGWSLAVSVAPSRQGRECQERLRNVACLRFTPSDGGANPPASRLRAPDTLARYVWQAHHQAKSVRRSSAHPVKRSGPPRFAATRFEISEVAQTIIHVPFVYIVRCADGTL